jgi:hypothetical protein
MSKSLREMCEEAGVEYLPEYDIPEAPLDPMPEEEPLAQHLLGVMQQQFRHTPDMPAIFPDDPKKEWCAQNALDAGVHWLLRHTGIDIEWHMSTAGDLTFIHFDNEGGQELEEVLLGAAMGESDQAMMQELAGRLDFIAAQGWSAYCARERGEI